MKRMKNSSTRLLVCLILVTAGVALILVGNRCLFFVGLACAVLSSFFSQRRVRNVGRYFALLLCLVGIFIDFVEDWHDGDIFARKPMEIWWWVIFIGAWLWVAIDEFRRWWSSRSVTNAA
jgi:uncharacterized membrane protein YccC